MIQITMRKLKIFMKWSGIVAGILVVLFLGVYTTLNIWFGMELKRTIQELKAKGRPMTVAEFQPLPVPDEQNALPLKADERSISC